MCGILFSELSEIFSRKILEEYYLKKLRFRGPDSICSIVYDSFFFGHTRLSIVGVESDTQPFETLNSILAINGEIYNYKDLYSTHFPLEVSYGHSRGIENISDCTILLDLYEKYSSFEPWIKNLCGMFAFVFYDKNSKVLYFGRDRIGICPLYYSNNNGLRIVSEIKALGLNDIPIEVQPGYLYSYSKTSNDVYKLSYTHTLPSPHIDLSLPNLIRNEIKEAVSRHLMHDKTVKFGVLLSGGLDSSVVCACVRSLYPNREILTFSVGLENSPDLLAARIVAEKFLTHHTEIVFDVQDGLEYLPSTIQAIETTDITTVRSSVPMKILAEKIRKKGIKFVLSGEGSDEIFAGYAYNKFAPTFQDLHLEIQDKLKMLHVYDCLRANKIMMSESIECRVPFLDTKFVEIVLQIDPKYKMHSYGGIEKFILRKAFENILPCEICWRSKVQFSDGVGNEWISFLKDFSSQKISEELWQKRKELYPECVPMSKEQFLYTQIFTSFYPSKFLCIVPQQISVACSTTRASYWVPKTIDRDPSGNLQ